MDLAPVFLHHWPFGCAVKENEGYGFFGFFSCVVAMSGYLDKLVLVPCQIEEFRARGLGPDGRR